MTPLQGLYLVWVVWGLSWLVATQWSARVAAKVPARRELPYRALLVIGLAMLFGLYPHHLAPPPRPWLAAGVGWALVVLAAAGAGLCWWARLHIGRLWSAEVAVKTEHRVVQSGPYTLVRHPIYTGILVMSLATCVMRGHAIAWLGLAVTALAWYLKARMEEAFLRAVLEPGAYDAYAARVPMLIPFI
jgi:protein-S-isoprenylcysteine O-methyltransferase Ste14